MIYLATPYSHHDRTVVQYRVDRVTAYAATLHSMGVLVYSPVTHGHQLANVEPTIKTDAESWIAHNLYMLKRCNQLLVLGYPREIGISQGCQTEIKFAQENDIPVTYKLLA